MAMFSPAAAAKKAGVSRSLISRALKDGSLKGTRRNNGHWSIVDTDLADWMNRATLRAETEKTATEVDQTPQATERDPGDKTTIEKLRDELSRKSEELADAKARLEVTQESLSETRRDRDAWKEQAQKLAAKEKEQQPSSNTRPGLFKRIFG